MSIVPFIKSHDGSFDPDMTRAMGRAFDAARTAMGPDAHPAADYQRVAAKIIDAARKGERDPERLTEAGLVGFGT